MILVTLICINNIWNSFLIVDISVLSPFFYSQRVNEQVEQKLSALREELVATKEALNRAMLDKEVLDGQNKEVGELGLDFLFLRWLMDVWIDEDEDEEGINI